jgi:hypothetical protein
MFNTQTPNKRQRKRNKDEPKKTRSRKNVREGKEEKVGQTKKSKK